jgi:hypothetical protein
VIAIILSGIWGEFIGIIPVLIISVSLGISFLAYSWFFTNFRALNGQIKPESSTISHAPSLLKTS